MSGTVALQVDGPLSSRAVSPEGMLLVAMLSFVWKKIRVNLAILVKSFDRSWLVNNRELLSRVSCG